MTQPIQASPYLMYMYSCVRTIQEKWSLDPFYTKGLLELAQMQYFYSKKRTGKVPGGHVLRRTCNYTE